MKNEMKKLIVIIVLLCFNYSFSQTISTPLPTGSISVSGTTVLGFGTSPGVGYTFIDNTGTGVMNRTGTKSINTMLLRFNDDDEFIMTFGTLIVPSGGKIISVATSGSSDSINLLVNINSDNSIVINREDTASIITEVSITFIVDGWSNVSEEKTSKLPFELKNQEISTGLFASDAIVDAEFTGLQRNDDRTLVEFWFSSMNFSNSTGLTGSFVRVKNGVNQYQGFSFPIAEITFINGFADVETTAATLSSIGLTKIRLRISEAYIHLSSGLNINQTLFNSQYIFKNEIESGLKQDIVNMPSEIMGDLDDVGGFNFKEAFKQFSLTSEFNELPLDNYVRLNYFALNVSAKTLYISFKIFDSNDLQISEIAGSSVMTVNYTDLSDVSQDITIDGWRVRWKADFSFLTANTTLSGLTKENARFKIPAKNLDRTYNYFDENYNTLGNTVNKRNFDLSRFVKSIRIVPNSKEFLIENGDLKDIRIRYFSVTPTNYYMSFRVGSDDFTGVQPTRNANSGIFDVEFAYPEFKAIVTAKWNNLENYLYNYDSYGNGSATLKKQVVLDAYTEAEMLSNSSGLTFNDYYQFAASTERMLPYLYKDLDWAQSSKIPRTNFMCIPDHNDEPEAVNKLLSWVKSDAAIEKAIPTALLQGDFITTTTITSAQAFIDKINIWFDHLPNDTPVLWCNGNHDLGLDGIQDFADAPSANTRRTLIHDRLYNRLPPSYQAATVRGTATDAMYYYTDVPNTNTRVIALDQFEYPMVAGVGRPIKYAGTAIYQTGTSNVVAGFNMYYTEAQLNFLINALETLPSVNTAIVMTHIPINSDADGEKNALGNSNIALRAILKAYRDKVATTVTVNAIDEIPAFNVTMDFTGRTDSRMLYTYGHIHKFKYFTMADAGNIHTVQCMAAGNTSPYLGIDGNSVSKYGADIISMDEDKDEMYILRYGSRRTIDTSGIPIGTDEHGFNFISRPLKLGN